MQGSKYDCNPNDSQELESLQQQIQARIQYLKENDLDTFSDSVLLQYYELHQQIQSCLFQDHTSQYLVIGVVLIVIPLIVIFRLKMIKKTKDQSKK